MGLPLSSLKGSGQTTQLFLLNLLCYGNLLPFFFLLLFLLSEEEKEGGALRRSAFDHTPLKNLLAQLLRQLLQLGGAHQAGEHPRQRVGPDALRQLQPLQKGPAQDGWRGGTSSPARAPALASASRSTSVSIPSTPRVPSAEGRLFRRSLPCTWGI